MSRILPVMVAIILMLALGSYVLWGSNRRTAQALLVLAGILAALFTIGVLRLA